MQPKKRESEKRKREKKEKRGRRREKEREKGEGKGREEEGRNPLVKTCSHDVTPKSNDQKDLPPLWVWGGEEAQNGLLPSAMKAMGGRQE